MVHDERNNSQPELGAQMAALAGTYTQLSADQGPSNQLRFDKMSVAPAYCGSSPRHVQPESGDHENQET